MRRVAWLAFLFAAPCRAQGRGGDSLYPPDRLTVRPAVVAMPTFHYPPELHGHRPHGHIVVRLVLDTAGHVEPSSITILETPDSVLDAATRAFAAAVLFRPAEARGRRVRVEVDLPIDVQAPDTSNRPLPLGAVEQKPA